MSKKTKKVKYPVPSNWVDGVLSDKKFSYTIYLNLLKDSKKAPNEEHRYKPYVYPQRVQRETTLALNTCRSKLNYMTEKGFIEFTNDDSVLIHKPSGYVYTLIDEEELDMLISMGKKGEFAIRMYIYLKGLEYICQINGTKIAPSQVCIANRIGLSSTNRINIKYITDMLVESKILMIKKKWSIDETIHRPTLKIEYFLPFSG